jgi:hypothetical protein
MLKVALGHLRGLPGAPKSSGIKGKPDDFFPISVTPIKIENHEDSVLTTFSRMYCIQSKRDEAFFWHFSTFFDDN